jgi:hypothetical protein
MSTLTTGPYFIKAQRNQKYPDLYRYQVMAHTETINVVVAEIDNSLPDSTLLASSWELLRTLEDLLALVKKHGIGDNEDESFAAVSAATMAVDKARMRK